MKILVTGPDGFVGKALVKRLREDGHDVIEAGRARIGDIRSAAWDEIMPGVEAVVHLAARVHQMKDDSDDPLAAFRAVNRDATLCLAEAARRYGVKRFVFLSSVKAAIDRTDKEGVDESVPPSPQSPYGISKLEAEQGLLSIPEIAPVILRPPLIYGPGAKGNFASLAKLIQYGVPLPVGGIDNRRSFLGLGNLVSAIEAALVTPAATGVFYVAEEDPLSTADLARALTESLRKKTHIISINHNVLSVLFDILSQRERYDRLADSLVVRADKFKQATGWRPVIPMREELARFAADLYR